MVHHKAFSKQCWSRLQKHEADACSDMQKTDRALSDVQSDAYIRYSGLVLQYAGDVTEDSEILELGCGVVCLAQAFPKGKKTYLDPLLHDYRRACPGGLPKGTYLTDMAEDVHEASQKYDVILALRLLSYVENPELVLHEAERLLKRDGTFMISVETWPPLLARLHYYMAQFFPKWILKERLYCYACNGLEKTLERHFVIQKKQALPNISGSYFKREWFYVCKRMVDE